MEHVVEHTLTISGPVKLRHGVWLDEIDQNFFGDEALWGLWSERSFVIRFWTPRQAALDLLGELSKKHPGLKFDVLWTSGAEMDDAVHREVFYGADYREEG